MALIDETVFVMMICGLLALTAYAIYLRFFVVRRLNRRLDQLVDQRLASAPTQTAVDGTERENFNRRLAVLERIVTDGGIHTAAQIEALRDREPEPEPTR